MKKEIGIVVIGMCTSLSMMAMNPDSKYVLKKPWREGQVTVPGIVRVSKYGTIPGPAALTFSFSKVPHNSKSAQVRVLETLETLKRLKAYHTGNALK